MCFLDNFLSDFDYTCCIWVNDKQHWAGFHTDRITIHGVYCLPNFLPGFVGGDWLLKSIINQHIDIFIVVWLVCMSLTVKTTCLSCLLLKSRWKQTSEVNTAFIKTIVSKVIYFFWAILDSILSASCIKPWKDEVKLQLHVYLKYLENSKVLILEVHCGGGEWIKRQEENKNQ